MTESRLSGYGRNDAHRDGYGEGVLTDAVLGGDGTFESSRYSSRMRSWWLGTGYTGYISTDLDEEATTGPGHP